MFFFFFPFYAADQIELSGCKQQKFTMANLSKRKFTGKVTLNGREAIETGLGIDREQSTQGPGRKSYRDSLTTEAIWSR